MIRIYPFLIFCFCCLVGTLEGQHNTSEEAPSALEQVIAFLHDNGLNIAIEEIQVTSFHSSEHNGVTHIYFTQLHEGLPIEGTESNVAIAPHANYGHIENLLPDFEQRVSISSFADPRQVVQRVAQQLDLPFYKSSGKLHKTTQGTFQISDLPYAREAVELTPMWVQRNNTIYEKGWLTFINSAVNADMHHIISNGDGQILKKHNLTISCGFDHDHNYAEALLGGAQIKPGTPITPTILKNVDGSGYRVFAAPVESPIHGGRTLVTEPSDPIASPHGWHDTNNLSGPEFTITRGNNVHAYQDIENDDESDGDEPDGGSALLFDLDWSVDSSLESNLDATVTNLFYWNNLIHDWSYRLGFNEAAGNFQENNYGRGGRPQDKVNAQALDGGDVGNANFSGPRDGSEGRMQMYRWVVGNNVEIISPAALAGEYATGNASFGPTTFDDVVGTIAIVDDGIGESTDACDPIQNGALINGSIALIDRGTCDFSFKVFAAQEAGALAAVVCNNQDDAPLVNMAAGQNAALVTIPSVFLSKEDCSVIREAIVPPTTVTLRIQSATELASSLDNGIVAHEYGHGISLRLAGGANTSGCLSNDEQVGEGWSDFIGLVLTHEPDANPRSPRGIGTYVLGQHPSGSGIRRYRYSTDMAINPQTHSHIRASSRPHPVGEVWASALWDMYWEFIDIYGYDPTWTDFESGNFRALQLVFDGLKLQGCDAGILEARDGILAADQLNYFGEHQCLIWDVFARRGMGEDASQGNADSRYDNTDGFQVPLSCTGRLHINRKSTPIIDVGDEIEVSIRVQNFGEDLTDVTVNDLIPDGLDVIVGDADPFKLQGNDQVVFELGDIPNGQSRFVSYRLSTERVRAPESVVFDNFEGRLQFDRESNDFIKDWNLTTAQSNGGDFSIAVAGDSLFGSSAITYNEPIQITDDNKLLKFDQLLESELGFDGGIVEISIDRGLSWDTLAADAFLVNPYNEVVTFDTRYRNTVQAFSGDRPEWMGTIVDLSTYRGEEILIRLRYIAQTAFAPFKTAGWFVDNFEVYDRLELVGTASLFSAERELATASSSTYVNSDARTTPVVEIDFEEENYFLSPNPVVSILTLGVRSSDREEVLLEVVSMDGVVHYSDRVTFSSGYHEEEFNLSTLASGTYVLRIVKPELIQTTRIIKI